MKTMEWIKVSERLPDTGRRVLVTDGLLVCEANRNNRTGHWQGWHTLNDEYLGDITHWMPLPEPPK